MPFEKTSWEDISYGNNIFLMGGHILREDKSYLITCIMGAYILHVVMSYWRKCLMGGYVLVVNHA